MKDEERTKKNWNVKIKWRIRELPDVSTREPQVTFLKKHQGWWCELKVAKQ